MPRNTSKFALVLALIGALLVGACGNEGDGLSAVEGEPLELGELSYNVQITRLLNQAAIDDSEYLRGMPRAPKGTAYLAVFIRVDNEGTEPTRIPATFPIKTTRDQVFEPIETNNPFALPLGAEVPAGGQFPTVDSAAFSGPIKGSMLLYLVDEAATENRPLELDIPGPGGETGVIELDI